MLMYFKNNYFVFSVKEKKRQTEKYSEFLVAQSAAL